MITDTPLTLVSAFDLAVIVTVPVLVPGVTRPASLTDAIVAFDDDQTTLRTVTSIPDGCKHHLLADMHAHSFTTGPRLDRSRLSL